LGKATGGSGEGDSSIDTLRITNAKLNKNIREMELDKLKMVEIRARLKKTLVELREKYNLLVQSKADLQEELIRVEEDKLDVSKALIELQIENTKLFEVIQT
jgi:predicted nuclease with TOPRIM domain